jgi:hypothetical protein
MEQLFSQAFDIFSDMQRRLQKKVDTTLGRDDPNWSMRHGCPACGFEVSTSQFSTAQRVSEYSFSFSNLMKNA